MLRNLIVLPDGTEIFSGASGEIAIQSATITECVNSETELTLGSVCANMLEMKFITPGGSLNITAGDELTLYKVDEEGQQYQIGIFIAEKPTRPSANSYQLTAYDRVSKLDKDVTAWLAALNGWPYRVADFAQMVCQACGLTLVTTDLPNGDYLIQEFSGADITGRRLMGWVGEICARFCRANADGDIELAWYSRAAKSITPSGEVFYYQNSLRYEDYQVAAIEKVQLRLSEDDIGAVYPDNAAEGNTYIITGNYLLTTESAETLEPVAQVIYDELKDLRYTPCQVQIPANLDIHAGSIVDITDSNGVMITAYVMTKTQSGQRDTLECTGSSRRDSSTATNNETLKALSGKMLEIKKDVEGVSVKASDLQIQIEDQAEKTTQRITAAVQDSQSIIFSALEEYARTSDLESMKETVSTQLNILADELSISVSQTNEQITSVNDTLQSQINEITTNYRFTADGQYIGKTDSDTMLRLVNDMMQILVAGVAATTVDATGLTADQANIETLHMGDYTLALGKDGHLTLT